MGNRPNLPQGQHRGHIGSRGRAPNEWCAGSVQRGNYLNDPEPSRENNQCDLPCPRDARRWRCLCPARSSGRGAIGDARRTRRNRWHGWSPRGGGVNREAPIKLPAASELQRFNPAALLIDKRRKVTLADSQVTALIEIRNMINERNAPLLARYDSIRKDFSPPKPQDRDRVGSTPETDSVRTTALSQMRTLQSLLDSLSARRTADVGDVLAYLTDATQHRAAVKLLNEQDRDFSDKLPGLGQDGSGRGGRGGRSGRGQPN